MYSVEWTGMVTVKVELTNELKWIAATVNKYKLCVMYKIIIQN